MFACLRKGPKTIFKANILNMSKKKQIIISFLFSLYLVIVLINPKWAAISIMQTKRKIRGVSVWTPAKDFYTSTEVIKMCFSMKHHSLWAQLHKKKLQIIVAMRRYWQKNFLWNDTFYEQWCLSNIIRLNACKSLVSFQSRHEATCRISNCQVFLVNFCENYSSELPNEWEITCEFDRYYYIMMKFCM